MEKGRVSADIRTTGLQHHVQDLDVGLLPGRQQGRDQLEAADPAEVVHDALVGGEKGDGV